MRILPYGKKDFATSTEAGIGDLWDSMFENSFHLKQTQPTPTDRVYRRLVERFFQKWTRPTQKDWVLKLDMYNEATWTKYGYFFMERGVDVAYIDISQTIIKLARRRMIRDEVYGKAHPVLGDFRSLPFRPSSFEVSCSFGSIEHVPQWRKCLEEQRNATKTWGAVIVGVPNIQNVWMRYWSCRLLDKIGLLKKLTSYELHFAPQEIKKAMKENGLADVELDGYHLFPKQLRWLDLWIQQFPNRSIAKARNLLLTPILAVFERIERQNTKLNLLAEMLIAKGVKLPRACLGHDHDE